MDILVYSFIIFSMSLHLNTLGIYVAQEEDFASGGESRMLQMSPDTLISVSKHPHSAVLIFSSPYH